jgi:hypothetical protein
MADTEVAVAVESATSPAAPVETAEAGVDVVAPIADADEAEADDAPAAKRQRQEASDDQTIVRLGSSNE